MLNASGFHVQLTHVRSDTMLNAIGLYGPDRRAVYRHADFQQMRLRYNRRQGKATVAAGEVEHLRRLRTEIVAAAVAARKKGFKVVHVDPHTKIPSAPRMPVPMWRMLLGRAMLFAQCRLGGGKAAAAAVKVAADSMPAAIDA